MTKRERKKVIDRMKSVDRQEVMLETMLIHEVNSLSDSLPRKEWIEEVKKLFIKYNKKLNESPNG